MIETWEPRVRLVVDMLGKQEGNKRIAKNTKQTKSGGRDLCGQIHFTKRSGDDGTREDNGNRRFENYVFEVHGLLYYR